MQPILENNKEALHRICAKLGVKRMYVFGSAVSGSFRSDSDIDLLISFKEELSVQEYTQNYFALHYQLRSLFNREIDLITERTLANPYLISSINKTKQLLYEA